jgi:CheY-like chemotaxis protein
MLQKVLLVDDIDFFLEVEKDFLSNANVEVITARNGQQALEIALQERPGLVFMDVTMPVMDGLTACRILKSDQRLRDIPVVLIFAGSKDVTPDTCREAGCDGILNKPVDREAFLKMGRTFLKQIDRRNPRVSCRAQVIIRRSGKEVIASSEDLSETGMYLCCREEIPLNETLWIGIQFPGGGTSGQFMARVSWLNRGEHRQNPSLPEGFGVKFIQPSPATKVILKDMVGRFSLGSRGAAPL